MSIERKYSIFSKEVAIVPGYLSAFIILSFNLFKQSRTILLFTSPGTPKAFDKSNNPMKTKSDPPLWIFCPPVVHDESS